MKKEDMIDELVFGLPIQNQITERRNLERFCKVRVKEFYDEWFERKERLML